MKGDKGQKLSHVRRDESGEQRGGDYRTGSEGNPGGHASPCHRSADGLCGLPARLDTVRREAV